MFDSLFRGVFDGEYANVITPGDFLLCLAIALLAGLILAAASALQGRSTKSYAVTIALLPAIVCVLISGGEVTIHGPTTGDTSVLDFDTSGTITGGTFIGTGARTMAQTFSASQNQGVISVSVGNNVAAGTQILLTDSAGNVVLDVTPNQNFAIVILSCPNIQKGETYTITVGTASGFFTAE